MKTVKQINIERLRKDDRKALLAVLRACEAQALTLGDRALNYEGKIATVLDRLELELDDICSKLRILLGGKAAPLLDLLSETDNLKAIVKSSV